MNRPAKRATAKMLWCALCLGCLAILGRATDEASLVITGARVWTGNPKQPRAEAIALAGERILAVGGDEEIKRYVGGSTRVIDGRGGTLAPGFIDSHTHTTNAVPDFTPISLRFVRTRQSFIQRIAGYAAKAPKGAWILGGDWDHRQWGGELPVRNWIDRVTPDNPVWLYHVGAEMALANSAALRAAGITRQTRETPSGGIVRDAQGEPTGIIKSSAMSLVDAAAEEPTRETNDRNLDEKMLRLAQQGITSVHNITGWSDLLTLRRARSSGRLTTRFYAAMVPIYAWKRLIEYIAANGSGDEWLRWVAVKGYARNWPESDPTAKAPGEESSLEDFYNWVAASSNAGLHILVHDGGGTHQLLGIFQRVKQEQNLLDPRFRIEHVFYLTPGDAARFAGLGVIGSLQPELAFSYDDPKGFQNHLPYRLLLDSGARIAFGSDQRVGSPLSGIALAVLHAIPSGKTMEVEEALRAYTCDAAYAAFEDEEKGTLEPGKLADCVLIDRDLTRIPRQELREARVQMTVVGGKIVYERSPR